MVPVPIQEGAYLREIAPPALLRGGILADVSWGGGKYLKKAKRKMCNKKEERQKMKGKLI
jgi:hypothetical protein